MAMPSTNFFMGKSLIKTIDRLQVGPGHRGGGVSTSALVAGPMTRSRKLSSWANCSAAAISGAGAGRAATHCEQRMASLAPEDGAHGAIGRLTVAAVRACIGIALAAAPGGGNHRYNQN